MMERRAFFSRLTLGAGAVVAVSVAPAPSSLDKAIVFDQAMCPRCGAMIYPPLRSTIPEGVDYTQFILTPQPASCYVCKGWAGTVTWARTV